MLSGVPFTVIGVLPRTFVFPPRADPELWLPLRPSASQQTKPYLHFMDVLAARRAGRVRRGCAGRSADSRAGAGTAAARSGTPLPGWWPLAPRGHGGERPSGAARAVGRRPARPARIFGERIGPGARPRVGRAREVGVRSALGATTFRLVRQMMIEAMCLGVFGAGLGLLLGSWAVRTFSAITPVALPPGPALRRPVDGLAPCRGAQSRAHAGRGDHRQHRTGAALGAREQPAGGRRSRDGGARGDAAARRAGRRPNRARRRPARRGVAGRAERDEAHARVARVRDQRPGRRATLAAGASRLSRPRGRTRSIAFSSGADRARHHRRRSDQPASADRIGQHRGLQDRRTRRHRLDHP